jgi:hypothetical protein
MRKSRFNIQADFINQQPLPNNAGLELSKKYLLSLHRKITDNS